MTRTRLWIMRLMTALILTLAFGGAPARANDCDPQVQNMMMDAAQQGFQTALNDVNGSILEPPLNTVMNCLNNILSAGMRINWEFRAPNIRDLLQSIANRICQEIQKSFQDATKGLNRNANLGGIFQVNTGVVGGSRNSSNQTSPFRIDPRIFSPIDGSRMRGAEDDLRVNTPSTPIDVRQIFNGQ